MSPTEIDVSNVRDFWEAHPLAAAAIDAEPGTRAFYARFEELRERVEPTSFQAGFYGFERFAGRRVLDAGCGNGYLLGRFARHGALVTGIDLTSRAVELSARRFELESLSGQFVQASVEELPFRSESFELAISMGVLHHTPKTETAVAEIRRVLKPGSVFLTMLYHRNSLLYRFAMSVGRQVHPALRGKSMQDMVNRVDGEGNPLGKVYSRREAKALLADFEDVEVFSRCIEPSHFGRKWIGERVPLRLRELLARYAGWFLYARARKPR